MDLAQLLETTRNLTTATQAREVFETLEPLLAASAADRGGLLLPRTYPEEPSNADWIEAVVWFDTEKLGDTGAPVALPLVLRQAQPFVSTDVSTDDKLDRATRQWLQERWHANAVVVLPLRVRDRVVGVLWIGASDARAFTNETLQLYNLLACQAAIAVENALLHDTLAAKADAAQASSDEFTALSAIASTMNQSLKLDDVLNTAFDQMLKVLGLNAGALFLNESDDEIKLVVHRNLNVLSFQTPAPTGQAPVAKLQRPILLLEISQGVKTLCLSMRREGPRAIISVPLLTKGKLFGMMDVVTYYRRDFTPLDVRLLTAIGSQVAIAVENAQLYEDVVQAREELQVAYERLKMAQDELVRQEQLAILGQWAGSVGHELRNPLAVVRNATYYLRMILPDANEEVQDSLSRIDEELRRANKIITDLLDFPRLRAAQRAPTDFESVVDRAMTRSLRLKEVKVVQDIPADLPAAYVDAGQMEEVICNLVSNAVQAMDGQGQLIVAARVAEGQIEARFTDTGKGIAPEDAPKIFQPLFTTKRKGVGLGLAIAKSLTEVNGGSLSFESQVGVGTTFILRVPVYEETEDEQAG